VERFFALARSSPWRWRTLRFTVRWRERMQAPAPGYERESVRGWIARPDALRVESLYGRLIVAERRAQQPASVLVSDNGTVQDVRQPEPHDTEFDEAGLVRRRPWLPMPDDPMYENYHWVAMLDPRELADGTPDRPEVPPLDVDSLSEVDHHGRPVWEAVVQPTNAYDPRCSCCPLLFGERSVAILAEEGALTAAEVYPRYADAYRVRVDEQTGVCVFTEEIGGSVPGSGHEMVIESVDETLPEELFRTPPPRRRFGRTTGWSALPAEWPGSG
jgi:hypothetical protein